MLPLLDVFMVVLFVFATIQESQLDDSSQALIESSRSLADAEAELAEHRETVEALEREVEIAERRQAKQVELEDEIVEYRRACGPREPGGPVCPNAELDPDAAAQAKKIASMSKLQERLLDNVAVFEVEIEGRSDLDSGEIRNQCCVRANPPDGRWRACGDIPTDADARADWLDDGGDGLLDTIRRTHGGNAIVMIRQGDGARFRLTNDVAQDLRDRLPDHEIYDDGRSPSALACPLFKP